ncbi:MAG: hypothetical protein II977_06090 [Oscillospiraceae bacterium]|nr:hypothetical protein [Oscillospiraceae bacterium]
MKNRKVICITVLLITAAMIGVAVLSRILETAWQAAGDKENQLTVNDEKLQAEEIAFDYPYINYSQLNEAEKKLYGGWFGMTEDSVLHENKEFTYQQAANKLGEVVKYLTGYTGHQKKPMVIDLSDVNLFASSPVAENGCYVCRQITDELIIGAVIDTAGQFRYLGIEDAKAVRSGYYHKDAPSDYVSEQLLKTSLQYLQELGEKDTVTGYYTQTAGREKDSDTYDAYIVFLETKEGDSLSFTLNKEYGLIYYSKYPEKADKEFIPVG